MSARVATKEMNDVKDPGTVNKHVVQNWLRYFKEGDTSLKDTGKNIFGLGPEKY